MFISQVMLSCWCLIWCTLARCSTGAPDTTTSSSPTSGARDTSGLKKTSRWRQQSFLIQPLRWKYYWNHKKLRLQSEFGEKETPGRNDNWGWCRCHNNNRDHHNNGDSNNNSGATPVLPALLDGPECELLFLQMIDDKQLDFAFRVLCTSSDLIWRSKALTLLSFQFMTR